VISIYEILLVLLGLGSFVCFRWYSRKVVYKPNQGRQARLARISKASFLFQLAIGFFFVLGVYWVLAFLFGWPFFGHDKVRVVISQHHIYSTPAEMPPTILSMWLVKTGLGLGCAGVLFALFGLYGQGVLFAAKNVNYIRFLGYWLIIDWVIDDQMQGTLHDVALSTTPVFVGLLVIFIAWIMDEGRKIQEEQALTV
jgi:hypothetical protein